MAIDIDTHRAACALHERCEILEVSVSGDRAWQRGGTPDRQGLTDPPLLALIQSIQAKRTGAYGSPRRVRALRAWGFPVSQARVERLRRDHGLRGRHPRRYQATTDSKQALPVAAKRLAHHFAPSAPHRVWTADITDLWTDEGWRYRAIVRDLFKREVVGWSLQPRLTADSVTEALTMAWFRRQPAPGLIHPSDRGSQYASQACQEQLAEYGRVCSMSRKGHGWDNALTESCFNSFKNERVCGERFLTREAMKATAFEYLEVFYHRRRRHSTRGYPL